MGGRWRGLCCISCIADHQYLISVVKLSLLFIGRFLLFGAEATDRSPLTALVVESRLNLRPVLLFKSAESSLQVVRASILYTLNQPCRYTRSHADLADC